MKGKILYSSKTIKRDAEGEIPTYTVTKSTKYGTFTGSVTVCNEDIPENIEDISDMMGYDFAERKCDIQAVHAKAVMLRERANGMKYLLNTLDEKYSYVDWKDSRSEVLNDIQHQYKIAVRDYDKVYKQYVYMRDDFRNYTDRRIAFRKKALERKKQIEE